MNKIDLKLNNSYMDDVIKISAKNNEGIEDIKDAIKENPKSCHLKDVCQGFRKQAGGFIWKYAS